jgi:hypothetical protein
MKAAVLSCLVAYAAAFAPSATTTSRSSRASEVSVSGAMDSMEGSIDFRGKEFKFDPLKLSETFSPWLPWFKESEIRHGRTAMLAVVGFIVPEFVRLPGDIYSFENVPSAALAHEQMIKDGPLAQLLLWIGLWDLIVTGPACAAMMKGEREPGGTSILSVCQGWLLEEWLGRKALYQQFFFCFFCRSHSHSFSLSLFGGLVAFPSSSLWLAEQTTAGPSSRPRTRPG